MTYVLNVNDYDKRGNKTFTQGYKQKRGGLDYHQPSDTWERVGLNVRCRFHDDEWIDKDGNPNEWAVAYHGVRDPTGYAFPRIVLEGFQIGLRQAPSSYKFIRTGQIIGCGI